MIVNLSLKGGLCIAEPAQYLGDTLYTRFRQACTAGGAPENRSAKAPAARLDGVPILIKALQHYGFQPRIDPALAVALRGRASEARESISRAQDRIKFATVQLAKKGYSLMQFQEIGVEAMAPRRSFLLGDDVGCCKTFQALTAAPEGPIMVCATAKAKRVWPREAEMWRPDLERTVLDGKGTFRWPSSGELVCLNYELLPACPNELRKAAKLADLKRRALEERGAIEDAKEEELKSARAMDALAQAEAVAAACPKGLTLIFDEAHRLKTAKSQRTVRARRLIKTVLAAGGRAWALTGTPLMNRPEELSSLLFTFNLFEESFGSWPRFLRLMQGKKLFHGGYAWGEPMPQAAAALARVMLRRLFREVQPQMPRRMHQIIDVDASSAIRKIDAQAAADLAARGTSIEDIVGMGEDVPFEMLSYARKAMATALIPAMLEIAEEHEEAEEPLLIFSAHRPPIDALASRPGWAVITGDVSSKQADLIVEQFQAGKLKGVGISIKSGGEALTLTRSHISLFVDLEWVPALNHQAEGRNDRMGQTRGVLIKRLNVPGTLCERVNAILAEKTELIAQTVDAAAIRPSERPKGFTPEALDAAAEGRSI